MLPARSRAGTGTKEMASSVTIDADTTGLLRLHNQLPTVNES